jgi:hypothetical protein
MEMSGKGMDALSGLFGAAMSGTAGAAAPKKKP